METVCHNQLIFESLSSKEIIADFAGGRITSDADVFRNSLNLIKSPFHPL